MLLSLMYQLKYLWITVTNWLRHLIGITPKFHCADDCEHSDEDCALYVAFVNCAVHFMMRNDVPTKIGTRMMMALGAKAFRTRMENGESDGLSEGIIEFPASDLEGGVEQVKQAIQATIKKAREKAQPKHPGVPPGTKPGNA